MLDAGDDSCFAEKLLLELRADTERRIEHLDGDVALETRIVGSKHGRESTDSKRVTELERVTQCGGKSGSHGVHVDHHGTNVQDVCRFITV
jgi:phage baseplate assembly protein gpV